GAIALAVARSCLDTFGELAGAKTPRATPMLLREQPTVQLIVGRAEADLRSGRAFLMESVRELWAAATSGTVSLDHRATLRLAATRPRPAPWRRSINRRDRRESRPASGRPGSPPRA